MGHFFGTYPDESSGYFELFDIRALNKDDFIPRKLDLRGNKRISISLGGGVEQMAEKELEISFFDKSRTKFVFAERTAVKLKFMMLF